jgi:secreted Zn-dependent insulinase-like peptidase
VRIVETDLVDLWYKKDDTFKLPKAYIAAKIYTGDCGFGSTARGRVFADCWDRVVTEYVREYAYMGDCAQLKFNISLALDNINITWSGYNDSMPAFVSGLMDRITKLSTESDVLLEDLFSRVKEQLL